MKRATEKLLADLLQDDSPPQFGGALMEKTMRAARQRKRRRRLGLTLSAAATVGVFTLVFCEMRQPAVLLKPAALPIQTRQAVIHKAASAPLKLARIVSTKNDPAFVVIRTSEADRPAEINDQQLYALLNGRPVALISQGKGQAKLVLFSSSDGNSFPVQ